MKIKIVTHKENANLIKVLKVDAEPGEIEKIANIPATKPIYDALIRVFGRVAGKEKNA